MPTDNSTDPLEGKGEEMIPERGLPFDFQNESPDTTQDDPSDKSGEILEGSTPEEPGDHPESQEDQAEATLSDDVPEADVLPDDAETPAESAFPEGVESEPLLDFFDSMDDSYTPILDDLDSDKVEEEDEPLRSPHVNEAEISPDDVPESEPETTPEVVPEATETTVTEEESALWEIEEDEAIGFMEEDEAVFAPSDDSEASFLGEDESPFEVSAEMEAALLGDGIPFAEKPEYAQPPEDAPDDGMPSVMEEALAMEEIPPELEDGGMSAGYPPVRDEDLIPAPSAPTVEPESGPLADEPAFSPESFEEPGPQPHVEENETVTHNHEHGHAPDTKMLELLVPEDQIEQLWVRADKAQQGVNEYVSTLKIAQKMLDYLQIARNEMLGGLKNYEEAERYVNEVEYRVALNKKLKDISKGYVARLYIYEIAWAVVLLLILILSLGAAAFASTEVEGTTKITYLVGSMIWGGFGGVIGALLSLIKHISIDQDFDKQHTWWYIHSPLMGIGTGAVVFLFMHVGLSGIIGAEGEIASPIVIYILAWLSGYQHNVFTDLVKRMIKTLMGESQKDDQPEDEISKTKPAIEAEG